MPAQSKHDASTPAARPVRLAYVVSHPIQYQSPLLRRIAADPEIDLTVFFCSDFSLRTYKDEGFGAQLTWDVPLTEGFRSVVLPRWRDTSNPRTSAPISRGFLRAFARGVDGHRFDALWVHGYSSINAVHAILAAKAVGMPVLVRAEPWLSDRPRSQAKLFLKKMYFRALRSLVSAVLPIGTQNARYWSYYFGKDFPAFLMPYAVDNEFFARGRAAAAESRAALQAEFALEPQRQVILFASKLQKRKHCDDLLEAYLSMIEPMPSEMRPYLMIVGDGEQMQDLRQRVQQVEASLVRFAGFRNQRELPRFFDLASVFVLPSRHEAWGLIVNEAMASSVAVIVSDDVGCAADLVHNDRNGYIFPVGDRSALQQALERTLSLGAADHMGAEGKAIIERWSFNEDVAGLKKALAYVTRLPIGRENEAPEQAHATGTL